MMRYFHHTLLSCLALLFTPIALAQTLTADFRHRPPEMVLDEATNSMTGPLKDIVEQATQKLGYSIEWRSRPFARSLADLETNQVDIVPRVIKTSEREAFVRFVGPISEQTKNILFITHGEGMPIKEYQDLTKLNVGVKRGTAYFEQFDNDNNIRETVVADDYNLARMLEAKRIDAIIVLDEAAIEQELKNISFTNYKKADYFFPNVIGNYYGLPKNHPLADKLADVLQQMVQNGEVNAIYKKYGLTPN
ncbi:amino acid ABC transporter substrate-binding protein [Vibrio cholerae]|nr:amino acid ABC transporter substrate-binding protein [Vibrio cholerae]